jgi:hypothetical protein
VLASNGQGASITAAGDLDGNGVQDLLSGEGPLGSIQVGRSYVIFGQNALHIRGDDVLEGDDNLVGGGGNDILKGGVGNDLLSLLIRVCCPLTVMGTARLMPILTLRVLSTAIFW